MSIRSNALGHYGDLSPELQQILRRNGMQAHLIIQNGEPHLAVQGHDSPLLTYKINQQQLRALTDGGTNSSNKKAYNTFTSLVERDFHMPHDFVHARNANGRVVMGLHGYRVGAGEYGRPAGGLFVHPLDLWLRRGILGWTPRQQDGFHMRRVGGAMFVHGGPMVAERPDRRIKPGELLNGGYGFYYKGYQNHAQPQAQTRATQEVTAAREKLANELKNVVPVIQSRPRPTETPKAYNEVITSDVYFSKEKWQSVLDSHGIVVDAEAKTLTVQSSSINKDFVYDLNDAEVEKLLDNSIEKTPINQRLEVLNNIITSDYKVPVTMEMLNTKELVNLPVKEEVIQEISQAERLANGQGSVQSVATANILSQQETNDNVIELDLSEKNIHQEFIDEKQGIARVHGADLYNMANAAWFREAEHGREVSVGEIRVEPIKKEQTEFNPKRQQNDMTYRMTAVINGESISHEITQRQYDKFMAVDDYHRMKLFSKVFNEVDMKDLPMQRDGRSIGLGILAALTVASEVAHGVIHHRHCPELYMERHGGPVYMKPGVDTPQDIARRAFDAGLNAAEHGVGLGR